jgi:hypothetical protein
MNNDKDWAYEEAVWTYSRYYPASCLKEIGEKKKTLSQENHFPPEIQTRYATNTSQKHYSFSQLVCAHAQTSTYIECGLNIAIFWVSQSQQGCAKHAHYSQTPLLKCNKYKLGNKVVHMYTSTCTKHFQEIILPVTSFITYMKGLICGRTIIREPKMDFTGLPSTIPDHSNHSNPKI